MQPVALVCLVYLVYLVCLVWFVLFVWLNQTNRINQINQMNQRDQMNQTSHARSEVRSSGFEVPKTSNFGPRTLARRARPACLARLSC
jgi:hypothetical protein